MVCLGFLARKEIEVISAYLGLRELMVFKDLPAKEALREILVLLVGLGWMVAMECPGSQAWMVFQGELEPMVFPGRTEGLEWMDRMDLMARMAKMEPRDPKERKDHQATEALKVNKY